MSVNNTCAISSSISFLISAAIWIHTEMPSQGYSQAGCRESSAKLATREIAPHRKGVLPISIQSVYSFQIIVPVVQRIEQGFPKPKRHFRCNSPISSAMRKGLCLSVLNTSEAYHEYSVIRQFLRVRL